MSGSVPTLEGFLTFVRDIVGVPTVALPDNSPSLAYAFNVSLATVNLQLACIGGTLPGYWTLYEIAVYNLGADLLINYAPDQSGQTYFADLRKGFGINTFVAGVVSAAYDQGTGETMVVADWAKALTLSDLQRLKSPYGRRYLEIAQEAGSLWGLS